MEGRTCCFTGHRSLYHDRDVIAKVLREAVDELVRDGYQHFISGGAAGFDLLAAEAVLERKAEFGDVSLYLYVPYSTVFGLRSCVSSRLRTVALKSREIKVTSDTPTRYAPLIRDRQMVEVSDICVSYMEPGTEKGGTFYTVQQAKKKGIDVIDLYDRIDREAD